MKQISTVIVGAGQAGLAMSKCLADRSIAHVVIERGEVANSWAHERWDSLKLLTPNWQNRLPGFAYSGSDPDGFMSMPEIVSHLQFYAQKITAPIEDRTTVLSATAQGTGYCVQTSRGNWYCDNLVVASGACAQVRLPQFAQTIPNHITQLTPLNYRNPSQLGPGGVLVVGASATGVQLASEIKAAGHEVLLAAGQHIRVPRQYRGFDIQWWMDRTGVLDMSLDEVDDPDRARRVPSLQLIGSKTRPIMDLNALQADGVEIVGRLAGIRDGRALFSGSLANQCALSDLKMNRLLDGFDDWAATHNLADIAAPHRHAATSVGGNPRLQCDLNTGSIGTIVWATGYQPDFSWLQLPVFDSKDRLQHDGGVIAPGLYVLGLPFLKRRKSALIDGVGGDAEALADHLTIQATKHAA